MNRSQGRQRSSKLEPNWIERAEETEVTEARSRTCGAFGAGHGWRAGGIVAHLRCIVAKIIKFRKMRINALDGAAVVFAKLLTARTLEQWVIGKETGLVRFWSRLISHALACCLALAPFPALCPLSSDPDAKQAETNCHP